MRLSHRSLPIVDKEQMCDTAGTLCKAATTVKEAGALEVLAMCTHGILSGNAIRNLNDCDALSKLVVTNVGAPSHVNAHRTARCSDLCCVDCSPPRQRQDVSKDCANQYRAHAVW